MKYIRHIKEVNSKDRSLIGHFNIVANFLKEKPVICVCVCMCVCVCIYIYIYIYIYMECPRRNMLDFGRVFLMLKYTDITQNTDTQS